MIVLSWCQTGAGRVRSVGSRIDRAGRILVIIAHPDDEILLAPLLGGRCVRAGASCAIVVMTAGENGCCGPGLGAIRTAEMARAAALFNARLTQWTYPDVMEDVGSTWGAIAGDRTELVRRIGDVIAIEQPDMILTFDPEHGSTGHPAHQELGRLVAETGARNVYFIETIADGLNLSNGALGSAWVYVANDDWQFFVRDAETHASQFTPEQVEILRNLPPEQRRVWFMPASGR